jgi:hypothetical protein
MKLTNLKIKKIKKKVTMSDQKNQTSWIQKILNLLATLFSRGSRKNSSEDLVAVGDGKFNPGIILAETLDSVGFQLAKLNVDPEDVTDVKVLLMLQLEINKQQCLWVLSESVAGMSEDQVILHLAAKLVMNKTIKLDDIKNKINELIEKDGVVGVTASDYNIKTGEYTPESKMMKTSYEGVSVMEKSMDEIVKDSSLKSKAQNSNTSDIDENEDFKSQLMGMWGIKDDTDASDSTEETIKD